MIAALGPDTMVVAGAMKLIPSVLTEKGTDFPFTNSLMSSTGVKNLEAMNTGEVPSVYTTTGDT